MEVPDSGWLSGKLFIPEEVEVDDDSESDSGDNGPNAGRSPPAAVFSSRPPDDGDKPEIWVVIGVAVDSIEIDRVADTRGGEFCRKAREVCKEFPVDSSVRGVKVSGTDVSREKVPVGKTADELTVSRLNIGSLLVCRSRSHHDQTHPK